MFFAGRLETQNVNEYEQAADYAEKLKLQEMAASLRCMAEVELQHEEYFYEVIKGHWLLPWMKKLFQVKPYYLQSVTDASSQE